MFLVNYSSFRLMRYIDVFLVPLKALVWWYTKGIRDVFRFSLYHFLSLEDTFSFREMLKQIPHLEPLHRDYGTGIAEKIVTRLIGLVFRLGWVTVTGSLLLLFFFLLLLLFLVWIFIPAFLLFEVVLTVLFLLGMDVTYVHQDLLRNLEDMIYY